MRTGNKLLRRGVPKVEVAKHVEYVAVIKGVRLIERQPFAKRKDRKRRLIGPDGSKKLRAATRFVDQIDEIGMDAAKSLIAGKNIAFGRRFAQLS